MLKKICVYVWCLLFKKWICQVFTYLLWINYFDICLLNIFILLFQQSKYLRSVRVPQDRWWSSGKLLAFLWIDTNLHYEYAITFNESSLVSDLCIYIPIILERILCKIWTITFLNNSNKCCTYNNLTMWCLKCKV